MAHKLSRFHAGIRHEATADKLDIEFCSAIDRKRPIQRHESDHPRRLLLSVEETLAANLIRKPHGNDSTDLLSYLTLEVEIDHRKVVAKEPPRLPEKTSGLLTIVQPDATGQSKFTPLQALDALKKISSIDAKKAAE